MANLLWFRGKLLELFAKQRECFRNIFQPHGTFLKFILNNEPTQSEIVMAQKAFQGLIDDGFIYEVR